MFIRSDTLYNPDKRQVGIYYDSEQQEGNQEEMVDVERRSRASNQIFHPSTYSEQNWRKGIMQSTAHSEFGSHQFIGEQPEKTFNLRRTVISEYSNALHN